MTKAPLNNRMMLLTVTVLLFLVFFLVFDFRINNTKTLPSTDNLNTKKITAYIDSIEKQNADYKVYIREVDFVTRPNCTDMPDEVTEQIPLCNPNGYLILNERPVKMYTVNNPETVYYHGAVGAQDGSGFTDTVADISFDEFYRNYMEGETTMVSKRIFFRGKDEKGLFDLKVRDDEILDITGHYTP